jgi:hypothetical protein
MKTTMPAMLAGAAAAVGVVGDEIALDAATSTTATAVIPTRLLTSWSTTPR